MYPQVQMPAEARRGHQSLGSPLVSCQLDSPCLVFRKNTWGRQSLVCHKALPTVLDFSVTGRRLESRQWWGREAGGTLKAPSSTLPDTLKLLPPRYRYNIPLSTDYRDTPNHSPDTCLSAPLLWLNLGPPCCLEALKKVLHFRGNIKMRTVWVPFLFCFSPLSSISPKRGMEDRSKYFKVLSRISSSARWDRTWM